MPPKTEKSVGVNFLHAQKHRQPKLQWLKGLKQMDEYLYQGKLKLNLLSF